MEYLLNKKESENYIGDVSVNDIKDNSVVLKVNNLNKGTENIYILEFTWLTESSANVVAYKTYGMEEVDFILNDVEKVFEFYTKFDGCSHLSLSENYAHLCGALDFESYIELLNLAYNYPNKIFSEDLGNEISKEESINFYDEGFRFTVIIGDNFPKVISKEWDNKKETTSINIPGIDK